MGCVEIVHQPLGGELRRAIGVHGVARRILVDQRRRRLAVDRAGRGRDETRNAGVRHRRQQAQRPADIDVPVLAGFADRLPHERHGGEMQDGDRRMLGEDSGERSLVADVALHNGPPAHEVAVTRRKIVEGNGQEARRMQRLAAMTADVAGAPRHEHRLHVRRSATEAGAGAAPACRSISTIFSRTCMK